MHGAHALSCGESVHVAVKGFDEFIYCGRAADSRECGRFRLDGAYCHIHDRASAMPTSLAHARELECEFDNSCRIPRA